MSSSFNRLIALLAIFLLPLSFSSPALAKYTPEQVKAVYLFRIANFVHWQQDELKSQINVCIPDNDVVRNVLTEITQDKQVRKKPFIMTDQDCDLLFISDENNLSMMEKQSPDTVFIGDISKFSHKGGAIELVLNNGRIKPRVNLSNIGNYSISSNFLRISDVIGELK